VAVSLDLVPWNLLVLAAGFVLPTGQAESARRRRRAIAAPAISTIAAIRAGMATMAGIEAETAARIRRSTRS